MRILHTADLHLGQTFHNFDRSAEQEKALECIEGIIGKEQPDAYVISGDVFHTIAPQTTAQELLIRHLMRAHELNDDMQIVVTAGNHDSNKIEIDDPLWNLVGVNVIASIRRNILEGEENEAYHQELFRRHIIEVKRVGKTAGYIVALPHCYPMNFPSVEANLPRDERERKFVQMLLDEVESRNTDKVPVVIMAHTAVRRDSGDEPDVIGQDMDIIGGIDLVNSDVFGEGYDYVALGHIHYAQDITGRIRYSGSILPVSFDENYQHSVSLVDIGAHGDIPVVRTVDVDNSMPVITIPEQDIKDKETKSLPWQEALKALDEFPDDEDGYIRLNVSDDGTIPPDAKDIAAKHARERGIRAKFCLINRVKKDDGASGSGSSRSQLSTAQLHKMSEIQLAELHYRETESNEIPEDLKALLLDVIAETKKETAE